MLVSVNLRPHAGLARVLDDLGGTLLDLVLGDGDPPGSIGGVAIHDPLDEPALPQNALVLGVGLADPDEVVRQLRTLARRDAAGLVLRAPVTVTAAITAAVEETGVALLSLARGASWTQLAAMLRSLLAEGDVGDARRETLAGLPSG
ncbi:PucR family transcriptional regulator, partial [Amycolatopsis mediterranei]